MKLEIDIDMMEVRKLVQDRLVENIAREAFNVLFPDSRYGEESKELKKKVLDHIEWSKMTVAVQEAILKMAAEKVLR